MVAADNGASIHPPFGRAGAGTVCRAVCHLVKDGLASTWVGGIDLDVFLRQTCFFHDGGKGVFPMFDGIYSVFRRTRRQRIMARQVRGARPGKEGKDPGVPGLLGQRRRNGGLRHPRTSRVAAAESPVWPKISHRHGEQARGSRLVGAVTIGHEPQPPPCATVGWLGGVDRGSRGHADVVPPTTHQPRPDGIWASDSFPCGFSEQRLP